MTSWLSIALVTAGIACGADSVRAADPAPPAKLADTLAQRLAACAICHGKDGEGTGGATYYPRIGGKPARYLYLQLQNFREGRRRYPQMVYLMRYMTDEYLQEIADYYSKLQPPYTPPTPPPMTTRERERGETLANQGDAAKNIPACAACHGKTFAGMQPAIPGLVGLNFDYIAAQLSAWKTGARRANAPDCMHEVATRLVATDISSVAKWLAARQGTTGQRPAPEAAQKLPLSCGGQAR
jgi:cytochrome c553